MRYTTRPILAQEPSRKMVKNKILMLWVWLVAAMCTRYVYKYSWLYFPAIIQ